jgi:hypothetical protein
MQLVLGKAEQVPDFVTQRHFDFPNDLVQVTA